MLQSNPLASLTILWFPFPLIWTMKPTPQASLSSSGLYNPCLAGKDGSVGSWFSKLVSMPTEVACWSSKEEEWSVESVHAQVSSSFNMADEE